MNLLKLSVLLIYCSVGIIHPIYATETEGSDSYWCESTTQAMGKIQTQFPADSLDGTVAAIEAYDQTLLGIIDVPGLPNAPPSTGTTLGDLATIILAIDIGSLTLGTAVGQAAFKISNDATLYIPAAIAQEIGLIDVAAVPNSPGTTGTIDGDLVAAISYIEAGNPTLGVAINNALNKIGVDALTSFVGPPATADEINTDLGTIITHAKAGSGSVGQALNDIYDLIDVTALPGPPVSLDEVYSDVVLAITYIEAGNPTLGDAINNALNKIGVAGLASFPGPPLPTDEIDTDLGKLITATDPGSLSVGAAVNTVYDALGGVAADTDLLLRVTNIRNNKLGGPLGASMYDQLGDNTDAASLLGRLATASNTGFAVAAASGPFASLDAFLTFIGF